jgi:uridine kinase
MDGQAPSLVLLAGPTCAGKSTLAAAVRRLLPENSCAVLALDRYYRDLAHLAPAARAENNFDHPDSIDWPLLKSQVGSLIAGRAIYVPQYDFENHVRAGATPEIRAEPVILVEGILALHDAELNALASLRVFIDVPDDTCRSRRISRDTAERGRTVASVHAQFDTTVLPMAEKFVRPSGGHADLILDGCATVDTLAEQLANRIIQLR